MLTKVSLVFHSKCRISPGSAPEAFIASTSMNRFGAPHESLQFVEAPLVNPVTLPRFRSGTNPHRNGFVGPMTVDLATLRRS